MIRRAFLMKLKPGALAEYKRNHDQIWPELVAEIKACGITTMAIFEKDPKHPNLARISALILAVSLFWILLSARVGREYLATIRRRLESTLHVPGPQQHFLGRDRAERSERR